MEWLQVACALQILYVRRVLSEPHVRAILLFDVTMPSLAPPRFSALACLGARLLQLIACPVPLPPVPTPLSHVSPTAGIVKAGEEVEILGLQAPAKTIVTGQ